MIINFERQKIEELNVFIYILYPLNIGLRYKKKKIVCQNNCDTRDRTLKVTAVILFGREMNYIQNKIAVFCLYLYISLILKTFQK